MSGPGRPASGVYRWKGSDNLPSVTTILGATLPTPWAIPWASKAVAEYAVRKRGLWLPLADDDETRAIGLLKSEPIAQRDQAGAVGHAVHEYVEALTLGRTPEVEDDVAPFLPGIAAFIRDWHPDFIETEERVYALTGAPGQRYAGTFDAIVRLDGDIAILDYKTSASGVKPEWSLQLAAYADADFIGRADGVTEDPLPPITAHYIVHLRPEGYRLVPLRVDAGTLHQWRRLLSTYAYLRGDNLAAILPDRLPREALA